MGVGDGAWRQEGGALDIPGEGSVEKGMVFRASVRANFRARADAKGAFTHLAHLLSHSESMRYQHSFRGLILALGTSIQGTDVTIDSCTPRHILI